MKLPAKILSLTFAAALGTFAIAGCQNESAPDTNAEEELSQMDTTYEATSEDTTVDASLENLDAISGDWVSDGDNGSYSMSVTTSGEFELVPVDTEGVTDPAISGPIYATISYNSVEDDAYIFDITLENSQWGTFAVPAEEIDQVADQTGDLGIVNEGGDNVIHFVRAAE